MGKRKGWEWGEGRAGEMKGWGREVLRVGGGQMM